MDIYYIFLTLFSNMCEHMFFFIFRMFLIILNKIQDREIKYLPPSSVRGQQGSFHPVRRRGGPLASGRLERVSASLHCII